MDKAAGGTSLPALAASSSPPLPPSPTKREVVPHEFDLLLGDGKRARELQVVQALELYPLSSPALKERHATTAAKKLRSELASTTRMPMLRRFPATSPQPAAHEDEMRPAVHTAAAASSFESSPELLEQRVTEALTQRLRGLLNHRLQARREALLQLQGLSRLDTHSVLGHRKTTPPPPSDGALPGGKSGKARTARVVLMDEGSDAIAAGTGIGVRGHGRHTATLQAPSRGLSSGVGDGGRAGVKTDGGETVPGDVAAHHLPAGARGGNSGGRGGGVSGERLHSEHTESTFTATASPRYPQERGGRFTGRAIDGFTHKVQRRGREALETAAESQSANAAGVSVVRVSRLVGVPDYNRGLYAGLGALPYTTRSGHFTVGGGVVGGPRIRPAAWYELEGRAVVVRVDPTARLPIGGGGSTATDITARNRGRHKRPAPMVLHTYEDGTRTYFQWVKEGDVDGSVADSLPGGSSTDLWLGDVLADGGLGSSLNAVLYEKYGKPLTPAEHAEAQRLLQEARRKGSAGHSTHGQDADALGEHSHFPPADGHESAEFGTDGKPLPFGFTLLPPLLATGSGRWGAGDHSSGTAAGAGGAEAGANEDSIHFMDKLFVGSFVDSPSQTNSLHDDESARIPAQLMGRHSFADTLTEEEAQELRRDEVTSEKQRHRDKRGQRDAGKLPRRDGRGRAGSTITSSAGSGGRDSRPWHRISDATTSLQTASGNSSPIAWSPTGRGGAGSSTATLPPGAFASLDSPRSAPSSGRSVSGSPDTTTAGGTSSGAESGRQSTIAGTVKEEGESGLGMNMSPPGFGHTSLSGRDTANPSGTNGGDAGPPIGSGAARTDGGNCRQPKKKRRKHRLGKDGGVESYFVELSDSDEERLDVFLANFPESASHVQLHREAKGVLAGIDLDDMDYNGDYMGMPTFSDFSGSDTDLTKSGTSRRHTRRRPGQLDEDELNAGLHDDEEALRRERASKQNVSGFTVTEESLRHKFKAEAEEEFIDLVVVRNRLREEIAAQDALIASFGSDVSFLSKGKPNDNVSTDEFAVQLTKDANRFAREHDLKLSDIITSNLTATEIEEIADGFLNHFGKGRAETREAGTQVTDADLGFVDEGVRRAEAQVEDLYGHEKGLMNSIRLATIAVANIMSFHASLELESTCRECFYIFERPRTLWPCGHTFCQSCLTGMYNRNENIICAECGSICEVGYTPNLSIELVANYQVIQEASSPKAAGGAPQGKTIEGVLRSLLNNLLSTQRTVGAV